jgi:FkbM family methyltransferase
MLRRAVIATLQPLVADRVYTVRNGLARGLRRRGGLGFVPNWGASSPEERFFERLALEGQTVYDVGGYEGVITLFFARRVGPEGRVITFEPNPRNARRIEENVRLNGFTNVFIRPNALGAVPGRATLVFPSDETARGSLEAHISDDIRREKGARTVEVVVDTLDGQVAAGLPMPDFVKLDVEGLERDALEGMRVVINTRRPRLYIEIHGADACRKLDNVTSVAGFLWAAGYHIHHVETGSDLTGPDDLATATEGHLYCT